MGLSHSAPDWAAIHARDPEEALYESFHVTIRAPWGTRRVEVQRGTTWGTLLDRCVADGSQSVLVDEVWYCGHIMHSCDLTIPSSTTLAALFIRESGAVFDVKNPTVCLASSPVVILPIILPVAEQGGGTCYAHAAAKAMWHAINRVEGRRDPNPTVWQLVSYLIHAHGYHGYDTYRAIRPLCPQLRLTCEEFADRERARAIVDRGLPVVAMFALSKAGWEEWGRQHRLRNRHGPIPGGEPDGSHAVVLERVTTRPNGALVWHFVNSWGPEWGNDGRFEEDTAWVQSFCYQFVAVYWYEHQLLPEERSDYARRHAI